MICYRIWHTCAQSLQPLLDATGDTWHGTWQLSMRGQAA